MWREFDEEKLATPLPLTAAVPATAFRIFTCSVNSTCTTTRSGSRSLDAACMHAFRDSAWMSITLHSLRRSWSFKLACDCKKIKILAPSQSIAHKKAHDKKSL